MSKQESCVEPARGLLMSAEPKAQEALAGPPVGLPLARVGKPAPDFEAAALVGKEFRNLKLSDYRSQWVALCFYPGDFTFV